MQNAFWITSQGVKTLFNMADRFALESWEFSIVTVWNNSYIYVNSFDGRLRVKQFGVWVDDFL